MVIELIIFIKICHPYFLIPFAWEFMEPGFKLLTLF